MVLSLIAWPRALCPVSEQIRVQLKIEYTRVRPPLPWTEVKPPVLLPSERFDRFGLPVPRAEPYFWNPATGQTSFAPPEYSFDHNLCVRGGACPA